MKQLLATLLFVSMGANCFAADGAPEDPVFHEKPLSDWLRTYDQGGRGSPTWNATDSAVRYSGTNAIALLLELLRQGSRKQCYEASMAFVVLGADARGAVPGLIKTYNQTHSAESRHAILNVFSWIGPAAFDAAPLLIQASTNTDNDTRANALWAMGEIHSKPEVCVPKLIEALKDPDGWTRLSAVHALGGFGADAHASVPGLTVLRDEKPAQMDLSTTVQIRLEASEALKKIAAADKALF